MNRKLDWIMSLKCDSFPYIISLCLSQKGLEKLYKSLKIHPRHWPENWNGKELNTGCTSNLDALGHNRSVVTVDMNRVVGMSKPVIYSILVHEAVHAWQNLKVSIGEKYPGDECEAYTIQMFTKFLIQSYEEMIAPPRKKPKPKGKSHAKRKS